jgi:hypothetical protein
VLFVARPHHSQQFANLSKPDPSRFLSLETGPVPHSVPQALGRLGIDVDQGIDGFAASSLLVDSRCEHPDWIRLSRRVLGEILCRSLDLVNEIVQFRRRVEADVMFLKNSFDSGPAL